MARDDPFQSTTEPDTKSAPFTVNVKSGLPAAIEAGLNDVVVGAGFRIVKVCEPDVPPPGAGVVTVTEAVPAIVMSELRMVAVIVVVEMNVVARGPPFHSTVEDEMNPVPVSVSVNPAPPAVVEVGDSVISVGAGLRALVTVNVWLFDVPPPGVGFVTVTG